MRLATVVFLLIGNGLILFWYSKIKQRITYKISLAQNISDEDKKYWEVSALKSEKYDVNSGVTALLFGYSLMIINAFHLGIPGFYIVIPIGLSFAGGLYLIETKHLKSKKDDDSLMMGEQEHYRSAHMDSGNWIIVILGGTAVLSAFWALDYFWN